MTNDPFSLRRFGIYSESDIALTENFGPPSTRRIEFAADSQGTDIIIPSHDPDLDAFLVYWTPERRARAVRGELTS